MNDVMLDLETMGTGPNAAIVSIGATEFDVATKKLGRMFYRCIDLRSAVDSGGVIDADTVIWWLKQDDEARKAIYDNVTNLRAALHDFSFWLGPNKDRIKMWGNGAAFDNVILAQAYQRAGIDVPWSHWNDRCYRTIKSMRPDKKITRAGTYHNALDDAVSQALHLMEILTDL